MSTSAVFFDVPVPGSIGNGLFAGLRVDGLDRIKVGELQYRDDFETLLHEIRLDQPIELQVPGVDLVTIALLGGPVAAGGISSIAELMLSRARLTASLTVRAELRIDARALRPLKPGSDEPDMSIDYVAVSLAQATLALTEDGDLEVDLGGQPDIPRCMIADTGVIIEVGTLRWLSPTTVNLPAATPPGFTGLYLDDVVLQIPDLPLGDGVSMDDVFVGPGGFSGQVSLTGLDLNLDATGATGDIAGSLLGFHGGLTELEIGFAQSQIVSCNIAGDAFLPFFDTVIGVRLGLTGAGSITATVTAPHTVTAPPLADGVLFRAKIADALTVDVQALEFATAPVGSVSIDGAVTLDVDVLDAPPVGLTGLTISADGSVTVEGGWISLDEIVSAKVGGAGFDISRIAFGTHDNGRRFVALDGALQLAAGLPVATSVEGLEVSWLPAAADVAASLRVRLDGIGLAFSVPGAVSFEGAVALTELDGRPAYRGHGKLTLPTLDLTVEAAVVIGRDAGKTFFFLHVAAELPVGIPLFTTGVSLYGLAGLVAQDMGPDRDPDSEWYAGWYRPAPTGVTASEKWTVQPDAFAIGLGATLGTTADDGFAFHARTLLVLLLPGPVVMLEGKGNLLTKRSGSTEPVFDALLVLDVPGKRFEAGLGASYTIPTLFEASGTVEAAFSWADSPPPDIWHVYLGREEPESKRINATWLKVLEADAWFMAERDGLNLGGWAGIDQKKRFGPVAVSIDIGVGGSAEVSWQPAHFRGELELGGTVEVRAFGIGVTLTARAAVMAQAPTPWQLRIELEAGIEIDLWITSFSWSTRIVLEWHEAAAAKPLEQIVSVALEHDDARVSLPASDGGPVPADVSPVLVFARPVTDPGRVGSVATDARADVIGETEIEYQLTYVALRRAGRVVALSGVGSVTGQTLHLPDGPDLAGLANAIVTIGQEQLLVTAVAADSLELDAAPAGGNSDGVGFQMVAAAASTAVVVLAVSDHPSGAIELELEDVLPDGNWTGGTLETVQRDELLVLSAEGQRIVCQRAPGAPPATGAAILRAVTLPALRGMWQLDNVNGMHEPTRLMLHAKTPFAWWRSNSSGTLRRVAESGVACGPTPQEEATCFAIDPTLLNGPKDAVMIAGSQGTVRWMLNQRDRPELWLGTMTKTGSFTLFFDPPVTTVDVWARFLHTTDAQAEVVAQHQGVVVARSDLANGRTRINSAQISELTVTGRLVALHTVCVAPLWHCVAFGAQSVSTGSRRLEIDDLVLTTTGGFELVDGVLTATRRRFNPIIDTGDIVRPGGPFGALVPDLGFERPPIGGIVFPGTSVNVVLELPSPCTRVRVLLDADAAVEAIGPSDMRLTADARAGKEVELHASERFISRVIVRSASPIGMRRFCWDAGNLGWRRAAQLRWVDSLQTVTDMMSSTDDLLPPGNWDLDVSVKAIVRAAGNETVHRYAPVRTRLSVGPAPGLGAPEPQADAGYPDGGPLAELATWITGTVPAANAAVAYRSHDVRTRFSRSHIARMYAAAGTPLGVRITDAQGKSARRAAPVVWDGAEHRLTRTEETWIASLKFGNDCARVAPALIARDDQLRVGAGELLPPRTRHVAEFVADDTVVHRVPFTSSAFIDATHHLACGNGRLRELGAAPVDLRAALAVRDAEGARFDAVARALGLDVRRPLPTTMEVSRLPQGFLLDSPEPLDIERLTVTAQFSSRVPMRRRTVTFARARLQARDRGWFRYEDLDWESNQPIRVRNGRLSSDGEGPWTVTLTATGPGSVEFNIVVASGDTAVLTSPGRADVSVVGGGAVPVSLSLANPSAPVSITGTGMQILSVSINEPFRLPVSPAGLRIVELKLSSRPGADDHFVRLRAFDDVELEGYSLWFNGLDPIADDRLYHRFASQRLPAGREVIIRGHVGAAAPGGMADGDPPADGMVVSLLNPPGNGVLESIAHAAVAFDPASIRSLTNLQSVASRDGTRLLLVQALGQLPQGSWQLACKVKLSGPDLLTQSIGGVSGEQQIVLTLADA